MPSFEIRNGYIAISNNEFDKIIKNNLRFKAIIRHDVDVANEKLSYYEGMIKNLGGVFIDKIEDIDIVIIKLIKFYLLTRVFLNRIDGILDNR